MVVGSRRKLFLVLSHDLIIGSNRDTNEINMIYIMYLLLLYRFHPLGGCGLLTDKIDGNYQPVGKIWTERYLAMTKMDSNGPEFDKSEPQ
jgi:hypothetical protein